MTTAPARLLAVRTLLLSHLRPYGLDPAEVGIIGDTNHRGGYHCGSDKVIKGDYSVTESPRDRFGLTRDASALDVGTFQARVGRRAHTLATFSAWLVDQCARGAPDTRDIREVIYSPDGRNVRRWDRLGRRTTGDDSHRFHTHISFFRDAIKAGRDQTPVFRRYLTTIGLIQEDDTMTPAQFLTILKDPQVATLMRALPWQYIGGGIPQGMSTLGVLNETLKQARTAAAETGGQVDEHAIIAGVLAGLDPQAIAAAVPANIAKQVADELAARLAG